MIKAKLIRIESSDACTKGVFTVDGKYVCMTLELPWRNNERNVSCIPAGEYVCTRTKSPRFNDTFEVANVPGRSHILFHSGNKPEDTEGCILVGKTLEKNICFVRDSRVTRSSFMATLKGVSTFELAVVEA